MLAWFKVRKEMFWCIQVYVNSPDGVMPNDYQALVMNAEIVAGAAHRVSNINRSVTLASCPTLQRESSTSDNGHTYQPRKSVVRCCGKQYGIVVTKPIAELGEFHEIVDATARSVGAVPTIVQVPVEDRCSLGTYLLDMAALPDKGSKQYDLMLVGRLNMADNSILDKKTIYSALQQEIKDSTSVDAPSAIKSPILGGYTIIQRPTILLEVPNSCKGWHDIRVDHIAALVDPTLNQSFSNDDKEAFTDAAYDAVRGFQRQLTKPRVVVIQSDRTKQGNSDAPVLKERTFVAVLLALIALVTQYAPFITGT